MTSLDVMVTVGWVTARALLGRRRTILMALLAGAPVVLGILIRLGNGTRPSALQNVLDVLIVSSVLPLVALVFGSAALGSELDDGTGVHLLTKPIPRWAIVVPKVLVSGGLTALLVVPSTLLAGFLVGGSGSHQIGVTLAFAGAVLVGGFVYSAIFVALGAATSRGLVIGLAYSLLWEGLLSAALAGTQLFSVREYIRGMASVLSNGDVESVVGGSAFPLAALTIGLVAAFASARLARHEIRSGD
ncbi:MAG TPA: ABC transporter permease [Candidatus Limnocylindrales bacterium]|nr:ABC transporter permease [Candidatus Limnocylindrales bacterium]